MKVLFDSLKSADASLPGYLALAGVGDDGFLVVAAGHDDLLYIIKGSSLVSALVHPDPSITSATLTTLGTSAVARL